MDEAKMIPKAIPCQWCHEMIMGDKWPGGKIVVFRHSGTFEGVDCRIHMVLGNEVERRDSDAHNSH